MLRWDPVGMLCYVMSWLQVYNLNSSHSNFSLWNNVWAGLMMRTALSISYVQCGAIPHRCLARAMQCHVHTVRQRWIIQLISDLFQLPSQARSGQNQRPMPTCCLYLGLSLLTSTAWSLCCPTRRTCVLVPPYLGQNRDREEVVQSLWRWWCSFPVIHIINSAVVIMGVLKRTKDESLMMLIMTVGSVSAGSLQCFLFLSAIWCTPG